MFVRVAACALIMGAFSWVALQADCPSADLNNDCVVDLADLAAFGAQWLDAPGGSANLDGVPGVTFGDFATLAAQWRTRGRPVTLVINEFMADNNGFFFDNAGDDDDWIEIYNYGPEPVDIGGMFITDDLADATPYQIPADAPEQTTIPAGGFLVLWADNEEENEGPLHLDFALARGGGEDIVLFDSNRRLIDSILDFGPQPENNSYGRMPDAGDQWQAFVPGTETPPTPRESNGGRLPEDEILITEIMYHPYNSAHPLAEDIGEEYIEIYNRGFSAVNLEGWRITDGVDFTFGAAAIGPREYLVVAADVDKFAAKYPGVTNVVGGWEGRLSNSGEAVEVTAAAGKVIDRIAYADQGEWARRMLGPVDNSHRGWIWSNAHDGQGKSLELISMSMPNEHGQNWAASLVDHGTPGMENSATGALLETVALVSTGSTWYYLDDGSNQRTAWREEVFDDSTWVPGPSQLGYGDDGEATLISYGLDDQNKHMTTYFRHYLDIPDVSRFVGFRLRILRDDGAVIYINGREFQRTNMPLTGDIDFQTPASSNLTGAAEDIFHEFVVDPRLLHDGVNVLAVEVHQVLPTSADISFDLIFEGTLRPVEEPVADIAPMILDTKHRPMIPRSADPVTVTAQIIDEQTTGVVVNLRYRLDGQSVFETAPMTDDGLNGDEAAGDSVFTGRLPAQADDAVVEFYVEATDAAGNTRTWPAPVDVDGLLQQRCNGLYQVDDSFDPEAAQQPGAQPTYYMIMTEVERAELNQIGLGTNGSEEDSDAQMNATFISVDGIDSKVRYNVGVRNRGHGTRDSRPNNYRVNFPTDRPWKDVVAINLNTQYTWVQLAGSAIFQRSSLATGDARAVQVRVNGRNLAGSGSPQYGSYVHIEAINSEYADHQFPGNGAGNAYKCMRVGTEADLRYEGSDPNPYRVHYFKETNESQDDWSDLIELTWVLSDNTPDDIYVQEVNRVVNVEQWLRQLALNVLLDNSETTLANGDGDDYYLYRGSVDTRFVLIQHDLDSIFGQGQTIGSATAEIFPFMSGAGGENPVEALRRLVSHPQFAPRYYGQLKDLIRTSLSADQLGPFLDNLLGGFVPQQTIDAMKSWQAQRNAYVLSLIPAELTIESTLLQNAAYYQTAADEVALTGEADAVRTRSVTANGLPAQWSAIDARWSIGQGAPTVEEETLVRRGSTWRYLDDGSNQGTAWYAMDFNDGGWKGPQAARLGYGGDGETSPAVGYVDIEPGVTGVQKNVTTYFRREFNMDDPSRYDSLRLGVLRDDGAVVYLNGSYLWRTNMPSGAIDYNTAAGPTTVGGDDEDTFFEYAVNPSVLRVGRNVLAVEVHQVKNASGYVTSSDLGFDLELVATLPPVGQVTGVPVNPGITRIIVQAFDGPDGTGDEIDRKYIDVWQNDSVPVDLSGTLTEDTTLQAASGPYTVVGDLTVPAGVTLTIQPGTTLFFNASTGITVNGTIVAEGTEFGHIRMAPNPGSATRWDGLNIRNTLTENRLVYVDMEYGDGQGDSILVNAACVFMNYMTFTSTNGTTPFMELTRPRAIIRNCVFPAIGGTEPLHGTGLSGSEYLIFDGCTFGTTSGYNDIVDFSGGARPGPIIQFYNCTFLGGGDDGPDLDGTDTHIEGCVFTNFHQAAGSSSPSYAVATGDGSEVCIVRNLFVGNDHCILHKEDVYTWAQNNTFVNATIADVSFGEPFRNPPRTPGRGTYLDSNIHYNGAAIFEHYFDNPADYGPTGPVYVYRSILPSQWHSLGTGDLDADPMFVDPAGGDFSLQPGSPAKGAGANGLDMGYLVPAGASISGAPAPVSNTTEATLYVGGPGIVSYRWRLVDNGVPGAWSSEIALPINAGNFPADPDNIFGVLSLTGLEDGHTYRVDVLGKNSAAMWQGQTVGTNTGFAVPGNPQGNASQTWTVDLAAGPQTLGAPTKASASDDNMEQLMGLYHNGPVLPELPASKSLVSVGGTLADDTVWTAQDGPYQVDSTLVVPAGVTLTIMPGATVFFNPGTELTVNGRIRAEGEPYNLIYFTISPFSTGSWNGIQLVDTVEDNLIRHAVLAGTNTPQGAIGLTNSNAIIDGCTWPTGSRRRLIRTNNASVIIRNCVFPDRFGPAEVPGPTDDNVVESINATGILPGGRFIIENNVFGTNKGHNDVIDFSGPGLPGPILQVLNNVFMGGGDECLDLGGDAWIEGNRFMHVHKDQYNTSTGDSNVISTGDDSFDATIYVVRNVFHDIDHVVDLKTGTYMYFEHNTVVGVKDDQAGLTYSAIKFLIPGRDPEGKGAYFHGNIFYDIPKRIFENVDQSDSGDPGFMTDLQMHNCLVPADRAGDTVGQRSGTIMDLGMGNFTGDPLFVDTAGDFRLRPSSPAAAAAGGIDLGAYVPAGAAVTGAPAPTTWSSEAVLTVAGAAITDYKYRLNGGAWSTEYPVSEPIALSGLAGGQSYTVEVIGRNLAGIWQSETAPTVSDTWTVDAGWSRLVINEVLAHNVAIANLDATLPDMVELYYDGPAPLDLAGMSLTDDPADPTQFTFGADAVIDPGQYLVLYADSVFVYGQIHLGFALDDRGEGLYLYDAEQNLVDSIEFGVQIPALSIGRDDAGRWQLTVPTFGGANVLQPQGDNGAVYINEWLTDGRVSFVDDFVEFYNAADWPVDLGGLYITDNPVSQPEKYQMPPLNFVAANGYAVFDADAQDNPGHLPFRLSPDQGLIALFESDSREIDWVVYGPQATDVSQGRAPDAGAIYAFFDIPTPGAPNPFVSAGETLQVNLLDITHEWSYDQSNSPLPNAWRQPGYDDGLWPTGAALLYVEGSALPAPKSTPLTLGANTYYFRTHFTIDPEIDLADVIQLDFAMVIDDGAVIWINGVEVLRPGFNDGTVVSHTTPSDRSVSNAVYEYASVDAADANLRSGDNVIAVEVHQVTTGSSDIVFGLALDAVVRQNPQQEDPLENARRVMQNLRVTEMMYNPPGGTDLEFIELQNIGSEDLDVTGVRLDVGITFTFPEMTLTAGQYVVVVNNAVAFRTQYGTAIHVAGEFVGNLSNGGENVVLRLPVPFDAAILRMAYSDAWYRSTDGGGYALVIRDVAGDRALWNQAAGWAAGTTINGTPGAPD